MVVWDSKTWQPPNCQGRCRKVSVLT